MTDRDLVRLYWPVELRPAFDALFGLDDVMGEIVASSTQPALGAIRLAWWREALERLDSNPPPAEPRLQAVARDLLPLGLKGAQIGALERGWSALLDEEPDVEAVSTRGEALFGVAGLLLARQGSPPGGSIFAVMDAARRCHDPVIRQSLLAGAEAMTASLPNHRMPVDFRPITMFACLALRDLRSDGTFEPEATPGRAWTLLRHRWTGRI